MSLLMQALRKAERAKQNHVPEEELGKPSQAFDDLLAPAPLSLEPLDEPAGTASPGAFARTAEPERAAGRSPEPARRDRSIAPPPMARPKAAPKPIALPDARTTRMLVLGAVALLIAAVFGYMYWHAMYGPGSSKHLPMVPMPGQNGAVAATVSADAMSAFAATAPAPPSGAPSAQAVPVPSAPPPSHQKLLTPEDYVRIDSAQGAGPAAGSLAPAPAFTAPAAEPVRPPATGAPAAPAAAPPSMAAPAYMPSPVVPPSTAAPGSRPPVAAPANPAPRRARLAGTAADNPAPAPGAARTASPPENETGIRLNRQSTPAQVAPSLQRGYAAFNSGDFAGARKHYQAMLSQEPNNRDALLGMAAIAIQGRDGQQAAAIYARLLEADPGDSDALAALTGLRQADPGQSESRLRRALEKNPEAGPALFALGNLYARQGRWAEAQQHYFRAYSSNPGNADYAFNLAVGLDRMNQGKLALDYYQRALGLARDGAVNFDRNAAASRARELGGP